MADKKTSLHKMSSNVNTAHNMNDFSNPLLRKTTTIKGITEINQANDEDREKIYQKIVELFIAAGYFRARIQNLEPFDKILGGIVWTLTGSFYDVDIEFKDDMTLAEKIKTSEKIIAALKMVNCPIIINPHQIQGLDYPSIYQILQWLVKKLLETRDERNLQNKLFTNKYFSTNISSKFSKEQEIQNKNLKVEFFSETKTDYISTGRLFRPTKNTNLNYKDPLRIYFTLVEYGMNKDPSFQRTMIDLLKKKNLIEETDSRDSKIVKASIKDNPISEKGKLQPQPQSAPVISNEEQKQLDEILNSNIQQINNPKIQRINTNIIEEIFSENLDTIVQEIEKFENTQGNENVDRIKLFLKEKDRLDNTRLNIEQQLESIESEIAHLEMNNLRLKKDNTKKTTEINNLEKSIDENKTNLKKLEDKIKSAEITQEKMEYLGDQIKKRETLKVEIQRIKKDCIEEKKVFESQVDTLEKKYNKLSDKENSELFNEIDKNYQAEYEKLLLKKKDLFEQNKIINLLTRKIQVYPSKLELIQYQKRFQELYDQVNKVSEKSKTYLSEINCREEIKRLVNQKLEIFVQLKNNYRDCKSKKDKENYKESLLSVIEALTESLNKTSERLKVNMKAIEDGQNKLNSLQQMESSYMKLIKEYNKEYLKYNR